MARTKSNHLKVLSDTQSTVDPATAQEPVDEGPYSAVPPVPEWMPNTYAREEWQRLAPVLVSRRVLSAANLSAFGTMCALHGKIAAALYTNGTPRDSLLAQHRQLMKEFGLMPGLFKESAKKAHTAAVAEEARRSNSFSRNGK